jgi:ribose 1,5-bisphosphokinase
MMAGILVAVVGPSGAGKDTLIAGALAQRPDILRVRRVITRPEAAGGEDFEGVSAAEFDRRLGAGELAAHWHAHGLRYGLPASLRADLAVGRIVLFNGSRAALPALAAAFPALSVIVITAPLALRAARLAARGREDAADIAARLAREVPDLPAGARIVENDASPAEGIARLLAALPAKATP